ncbi:hypothetical protein QJS10_CPB14g01053 [Acorus calamus]|uniref:Uncharacterized protein n=1 Tax=Acorus calamus TaxID=4465 RepID=A0AAV9DEW1_ACOCL|nr:hypothetical protein QJS10_CPB14g01053 [Acorus calamus]
MGRYGIEPCYKQTENPEKQRAPRGLVVWKTVKSHYGQRYVHGKQFTESLDEDKIALIDLWEDIGPWANSIDARPVKFTYMPPTEHNPHHTQIEKTVSSHDVVDSEHEELQFDVEDLDTEDVFICDDEAQSNADDSVEDEENEGDPECVGDEVVEVEGMKINDSGSNSDEVCSDEFESEFVEIEEEIPNMKKTPEVGPSKLKAGIEEKYNITLPYSRVLHARGKALEIIHGSSADSYGLIPELREELVKANPGSLPHS